MVCTVCLSVKNTGIASEVCECSYKIDKPWDLQKISHDEDAPAECESSYKIDLPWDWEKFSHNKDIRMEMFGIPGGIPHFVLPVKSAETAETDETEETANTDDDNYDGDDYYDF